MVWREHLEELLNRVLNSESSAEVVTKMANKFLSIRESRTENLDSISPTHTFSKRNQTQFGSCEFGGLFSKNDALRNEVYSMQFLQTDLKPNQSSLDPFALLAFFKCWMEFEVNKLSTTPEIMSFENLSGRINVLVFLITESMQRNAMAMETVFLQNIFDKYRKQLTLLDHDERMD